jgi:hypothetical protein
MVSTGMQGGCVCENCSYLRQGAGNVDIAGLFAPKPLAMSGADDWTKEIETKGLPELKALYKLYGAEDKVMAKAHLEFGHNYNQVSREIMYNWFNKHLNLGLTAPVVEKPFVPVPPKELSVYDGEHARPRDAVDSERLRQYMAEASDKQIEALRPKDADSLKEFRRVVGTALRVMIHDELPKRDEVVVKEAGGLRPTRRGDLSIERFVIGRKGSGEQVPAVAVTGKEFNGTVVVWIHPQGKASLFQDGKLVPAAQRIIDAKARIFAPDVLLTGEFGNAQMQPGSNTYAGYYYGYNRPLLANRVHDILTSVVVAKDGEGVKKIHLVGFDKAGPWVLLARGLCGDAVARTAADIDGFRFEKVPTLYNEMMLPGGVKYGGLGAFAALAAPGELYLHNQRGTGVGGWVNLAYKAAGAADSLQHSAEKVDAEKVAGWLVR